MSGNLSHSMRENYGTHGVEKYYNLVSASYRNPHFPGLQKCLHAWLDKWWLKDYNQRTCDVPAFFWDLAAGSGEVTEAIMNWYTLRRARPETAVLPAKPSQASEGTAHPAVLSPLPVKRPVRRPVTLGPSTPEPVILASDPYTAPAYIARTSRYCAPLSFADVADGSTPSLLTGNHIGSTASDEDVPNADTASQTIDMVISSFALHLCTSSELFALLYELSTKATWLVVIAPHKKPEIKPGWGWVRWNIEKWKEVDSDHEAEGEVEILLDRVRLRVWKSLNT